MNQHDDFIARVESYLDDFEGSTPMPDRIRQSVRASLPETKQTSGPAWGLRRFEIMSLHLPAPAQIGLAAAALVAAVVVGATIIGGSGNRVGGPNESPSDPASDPSTSSPSAAPSAGGAQDLLTAPTTGDLAPGDYVLDLEAYPARIEFTVPEGWWHYWGSNTRPSSDVHALLVNSDDIGAANGSAWGVSFALVDRVYLDPCDPGAGTWDPADANSPDAMVEAFSDWEGLPVTSVEDVTIGGYVGRRVELATDANPCQARLFITPAGFTFEIVPAREDPPQQPEQFTFLDVEGTVLVLWTTDYPGTNYYEIDGGAEYDPEGHVEHQAELRAILDSIDLVPRP